MPESSRPPPSHPAWLSDHAAERCAQRNLTVADLHYLRQYGTEFRVAPAGRVVLRQIVIPAREGAVAATACLEGAVLIVEVQRPITAYRNRNAPKAIRKKSKRARQARSGVGIAMPRPGGGTG